MSQDTDKDLSDWLSDLTVVDQQLDLQVLSQRLFPFCPVDADCWWLLRFQDLPDPHAVSSSIQQMWALTEVMQTQQTSASIGRFDVSGFYFLLHFALQVQPAEVALLTQTLS